MRKQIQQRVFDVTDTISYCRGPGRNDKTIVQCLGAEIMFLGPHLHRDRAVIVAPTAIAPGLRDADEPRRWRLVAEFLEDYRHVSPAWRDRYLAASVFSLRGSGAPDSPVAKRTQAALKG